jgi:hypothetical protein
MNKDAKTLQKEFKTKIQGKAVNGKSIVSATTAGRAAAWLRKNKKQKDEN